MITSTPLGRTGRKTSRSTERADHRVDPWAAGQRTHTLEHRLLPVPGPVRVNAATSQGSGRSGLCSRYSVRLRFTAGDSPGGGMMSCTRGHRDVRRVRPSRGRRVGPRRPSAAERRGQASDRGLLAGDASGRSRPREAKSRSRPTAPEPVKTSRSMAQQKIAAGLAAVLHRPQRLRLVDLEVRVRHRAGGDERGGAGAEAERDQDAADELDDGRVPAGPGAGRRRCRRPWRRRGRRRARRRRGRRRAGR